MLEKEEGWLQEEKPPGRSLLDGGGAGPTDRAEPLPSHGHTEASLHDETRNHSTATEERRGEENIFISRLYGNNQISSLRFVLFVN